MVRSSVLSAITDSSWKSAKGLLLIKPCSGSSYTIHLYRHADNLHVPDYEYRNLFIFGNHVRPLCARIMLNEKIA
jgi:hypothetical protein